MQESEPLAEDISSSTNTSAEGLKCPVTSSFSHPEHQAPGTALNTYISRNLCLQQSSTNFKDSSSEDPAGLCRGIRNDISGSPAGAGFWIRTMWHCHTRYIDAVPAGGPLASDANTVPAESVGVQPASVASESNTGMQQSSSTAVPERQLGGHSMAEPQGPVPPGTAQQPSQKHEVSSAGLSAFGACWVETSGTPSMGCPSCTDVPRRSRTDPHQPSRPDCGALALENDTCR